MKTTKYILILLIGMFLAGCSSESHSKNAVSNNTDNNRAIPVRIIELKSTRIEWALDVIGIIQSNKSVQVASEVAGKVNKVSFNNGDYVNKNDELVKLDDEYKKYDLVRAESQMTIAKADYDKSELDYKRYKGLFETKDISEFDMENYRLKRDIAKAGYLAAEAGYKASRKQFADTSIKAPFAGFLSQKKVEIGDMLNPGVSIGKIIDIQIVKINVEIVEGNMPRINIGDDVKVHLDTYSDEEFNGKVTLISPEADPVMKTFPVEIELTNTKDYKLKPGMMAKCEIITDVTDNTFLLPQKAVYKEDNQHFIFINDNNTAVKSYVQIGRTYKDDIEILDGVQGYEQVVVTESLCVNDGSNISPQ